MSTKIHEVIDSDFTETFDRYKEGLFSEEPDPIRETHFIEKQIDQGPWTLISTYHTDSFPGINIKWIILKKGDKKVLKQTGFNKEGVINWKYYIKKYLLKRDISPFLFFPALVVGKNYYQYNKIDTVMVPLSKKGLCGMIFNSINPMQHYILGLKRDKVYLLKRSFNSLSKLASVKAKYEEGEKIQLSVETFNNRIDCFINGIKRITINDSTYKYGKCGMLSNVPAEFISFSLNKEIINNENTFSLGKRKINSLKNIKSKYPEARLIKKIKLPAKCCGRSIRFGDLSGGGQLEYLIVHGIHPTRDSGKISMTATDSNGRIFWQKGKPAEEKNIYANDFPVQIYDIDNDGQNEVICEFGGFMQILDGKTGKIKHQIDSPRLHSNTTPKLSVLDSIYICNLSGKPKPQDLLVKDEYSNIYAYNNNLDMLWSYQCNTGHYPFTFDLNGTGRENVLIGYTLLTSDGKKIWELELTDHADAVAIYRSTKKNENLVAIAASNEGFIISDTFGRIKKHLRIGHMQTITIANLLPDSQDYQIATNTYWGNPGVIYILDLDGNIINIFQPSIYGSPLSPVKWTNENTQLILLSASKGSKGGLYNGYGQQAVSFPDDGHPILCNYVCDIDNDGLDEILCWDHEMLWIYRSEEAGIPNNEKPARFPQIYNQSNYRSNISIT
jgi:rhamnogalacturonan endolyase